MIILKQPKYYDLDHKKAVRFEEERKRIGIKLKLLDFKDFIPFNLEDHKDIHTLTAPSLVEYRWGAIKFKISEATGIPEEYLTITKLNISMKKPL